jgi:hypothetical protein
MDIFSETNLELRVYFKPYQNAIVEQKVLPAQPRATKKIAPECTTLTPRMQSPYTSTMLMKSQYPIQLHLVKSSKRRTLHQGSSTISTRSPWIIKTMLVYYFYVMPLFPKQRQRLKSTPSHQVHHPPT